MEGDEIGNLKRSVERTLKAATSYPDTSYHPVVIEVLSNAFLSFVDPNVELHSFEALATK